MDKLPLMEIKKAREIGFCSGVRRAINRVEEIAKTTGGTVWTIGPLVHNPEVISSLDKKGVKVLQSIHSLPDKKGNLVFPTHGLGPEEQETVKDKGLPVFDGTCPIVANLQKIVKKLSQEGYVIVIYGDAEHPEVKGALGWANGSGRIALATKEAAKLKDIVVKSRRLALLAQTTQNISSYINFCHQVLLFYLPEKLEIKIMNTICPEIKRRQKAARELAQTSDIIIVVGGRDSSNTRRLSEICKSAGAEVHQIETVEEISREWLQGKKCVGIISGTSTPRESVEVVEKKLKELARRI